MLWVCVRVYTFIVHNCLKMYSAHLKSFTVACSSLVTEEPGRLPNSFVLTSSMTQLQAFWSRYAQTEIIEVRNSHYYNNNFILI